MKKYYAGVYLVIEVDEKMFNKIDLHIIPPMQSHIKYLLGNDEEMNYLSKLLNIPKSELVTDYFKIVNIG